MRGWCWKQSDFVPVIDRILKFLSEAIEKYTSV